jgi:hypothetical protein
MNMLYLAVALAAAGSLDAPSYRARESARATLERLPSAPVVVALRLVEKSPSAEVQQAVAHVRTRLRDRLVGYLSTDAEALARYAATAPTSDRPWRVVAEVMDLWEAKYPDSYGMRHTSLGGMVLGELERQFGKDCLAGQDWSECGPMIPIGYESYYAYLYPQLATFKAHMTAAGTDDPTVKDW